MMKDKLIQWFNKKGINFFISTVLLVIVAGAIFTFYSRYVIEEEQEKSRQAQKVILDLKQLGSFVSIADVGLRGYMLVPEARFIAPYTFARESYSATLKRLEETLEQQNYAEQDSMSMVKKDIDAYMAMLENMYQLTKSGNTEEAQAILYKDLGYELMQDYGRITAKVNTYEEEILLKASAKSSLFIRLIGYVQWLLLLLGIPTLVLVLIRIRKTEQERKQLFDELSASNKKYIFDQGTENDEELNEQKVIDNIVGNLRLAADFVKKITSGDYGVQWTGLSKENEIYNKENLAGELVQMREQMKKVKEEDQRRLWTTEGLSIVAEITRKFQQDTDQLGDKLVTNVVQYLKANQAGLFVLSEGEGEEAILELVACYAYDRKKFLKKTIAAGEGLVGQAFLEADTIYLTEIPEEYINITSGLGKALPSSILIVPLKYNDVVMGIIEIASFHEFEDYQIRFVESLGEIIASALSTVKTNEKTRVLLQQSQEQAEEMRAQEEEMRQNMEELQATQEEMQRKTQEYEELIQEYKAKEESSNA
ncbi:CHASE3 domain-containing protein [Porifericola rhodea]|uniref:CHASE3 domain-containing protein n=1 Tax=Porifericola rhodea TaxID=930972 RepID=UPI0026659AB5|nr:CHASE3 domain-containing protein [Porifericola rhodea]WKN30239.1 CHASE3 domain-containing protein [Porifericola rhodea]